DHGVEIGLRGEARQAAQGHVNHVYARFHGLEVGSGLQATRVVGVQVNGDFDRFAQRGYQLGGRIGLEQASHILDAEDVRAGLLQLPGQREVVVEVVLGPAGIQNVAGVADAAFSEAGRLA
nr:hypothetical protein [Tanacetum cinerariifolium]